VPWRRAEPVGVLHIASPLKSAIGRLDPTRTGPDRPGTGTAWPSTAPEPGPRAPLCAEPWAAVPLNSGNRPDPKVPFVLVGALSIACQLSHALPSSTQTGRRVPASHLSCLRRRLRQSSLCPYPQCFAWPPSCLLLCFFRAEAPKNPRSSPDRLQARTLPSHTLEKSNGSRAF